MTDSEAKRYAAVCFAPACTRGQLDAVLGGDADPERARAVLAASAGEAIARAIGTTAAELDPDWGAHPSDEEQHRLTGRAHHA